MKPGNQNQRASSHTTRVEATQMKMVSVKLGAKWWDAKHQRGLSDLLRRPSA